MQAATGAPASMMSIADSLDDLLHSVSHDLRSPLLTVSLGTELIADAIVPDDPRATLALDSLRSGAKDLERMLDAVTLLSRARRRALSSEPIPLVDLLAGHRVVPPIDRLDGLHVRVDPRIVTETIATVAADSSLDLALTIDDSLAHLTMPLPADAPECEGSPLAELMNALRIYAGTPLAQIAALQAQLERQDGTMLASNGRLRMSLPREDAL